jgi:hypothetical protein
MSGQKSDMKNVSEMARGRNEQENKSGRKKLGADHAPSEIRWLKTIKSIAIEGTYS